MARTILHIDMDAFFAAIEQHDHPEWRGKPVIVGADPQQRGVVSTCSYEARTFGVHSAMPSRQAYELCPQGIFVRPRMERYQAVSDQVFQIFGTFTPLIEALSVDEAFLDVSGCLRLFGTPQEIATQIQSRIFNTLGLTCSIGIAPNKFLAKLASEERKPNGIFTVPQEQARLLSWLGSKPLQDLWGVGPKLAAHLKTKGLHTVRDLQSCNPVSLEAWTTPLTAQHLTAIAFGRDERPVEVEREEKSFSREHTYRSDVCDRETLRAELKWIAEDIGRRLREHHLWARCAKIKIRYAGFRTVTRQRLFAHPVCDDFALRDMAWSLLDCHLEADIPVRLIGFGVEQFLNSPHLPKEEDLFSRFEDSTPPRERQERLSHTLDRLRQRYHGQIK